MQALLFSRKKEHLAEGEGEARDEYCEGNVDSCSAQRSTSFKPFLDLWVQGRAPKPTYALLLVYVRSTLGRSVSSASFAAAGAAAAAAAAQGARAVVV